MNINEVHRIISSITEILAIIIGIASIVVGFLTYKSVKRLSIESNNIQRENLEWQKKVASTTTTLRDSYDNTKNLSNEKNDEIENIDKNLEGNNIYKEIFVKEKIEAHKKWLSDNKKSKEEYIVKFIQDKNKKK